MIHKTKIWLVDRKLADLGIDGGDDYWHSINVVIPNIFCYKQYYDDNDDIDHEKTVIYIGKTDVIINTPYAEFNEIMHQYYEKEL